MDSEQLDVIHREYTAGCIAFEKGRYRQSVEHLEAARDLVEKNSPLGGEVQIWLVTAYEAVGQRQAAIALCKQLKLHPHSKTRKQSRRLLEILEAPKLADPNEYVKIPDLGNLDSNQNSIPQVGQSTSPQPAVKQVPQPELRDADEVPTKENGFLWLALIGLILILGGLLAFS